MPHRMKIPKDYTMPAPPWDVDDSTLIAVSRSVRLQSLPVAQMYQEAGVPFAVPPDEQAFSQLTTGSPSMPSGRSTRWPTRRPP